MKTGPSEVTSALYLLLGQILSNLKQVLFVFDTCNGQNRNSSVIRMQSYFLSKFAVGDLVVIEQKFLKPGHTHLERDSGHARTQKAKKKYSILRACWLGKCRQARYL